MDKAILKLTTILALLLLTTSMMGSKQPNILTIHLTPQDDISKYNISNVHLQLTPGDYHLSKNLVLESINNFKLTGTTYTKIKCALPVGIIAINVRNITLDNIALVNCRKQHNVQVIPSNLKNDIKLANHNASVIFHNCTSMVIENITITVMPGITGILVNTINSLLNASNVKIIVYGCSSDSTISFNQVQINGIILYQHNIAGNYVQCVISDFQYSANEICLKDMP